METKMELNQNKTVYHNQNRQIDRVYAAPFLFFVCPLPLFSTVFGASGTTGVMNFPSLYVTR